MCARDTEHALNEPCPDIATHPLESFPRAKLIYRMALKLIALFLLRCRRNEQQVAHAWFRGFLADSLAHQAAKSTTSARKNKELTNGCEDGHLNGRKPLFSALRRNPLGPGTLVGNR